MCLCVLWSLVEQGPVFLSVSELISTCFTHTQPKHRPTRTLGVCVRECVCLCSAAFKLSLCVFHLNRHTLLEFLWPPPFSFSSSSSSFSHYCPGLGLILLTFTFLHWIYYLPPWLAFYGLMAGNQSHHRGQLQLQSPSLCTHTQVNSNLVF